MPNIKLTPDFEKAQRFVCTPDANRLCDAIDAAYEQLLERPLVDVEYCEPILIDVRGSVFVFYYRVSRETPSLIFYIEKFEQ